MNGKATLAEAPHSDHLRQNFVCAFETLNTFVEEAAKRSQFDNDKLQLTL